MQLHKLICSYISLHRVTWAYIKFQEFTWSFMSLNAVSWAWMQFLSLSEQLTRISQSLLKFVFVNKRFRCCHLPGYCIHRHNFYKHMHKDTKSILFTLWRTCLLQRSLERNFLFLWLQFLIKCGKYSLVRQEKARIDG